MAWIDHHCHLPDDAEGDALVADAAASGVTRIVNVGTSVQQSRSAIAVAGRHDGVWATAGVHPHDASEGIDGLEVLLGSPEVVAVGECGLDYHYDHSPRGVQREVFASQIELAHAHCLAMVVHTREAWSDTFEILDEFETPSRTVFHCFTGGPDEARECLDRGAMLSFSGIVTFPSAHELREAAALCPLDRMLVETDSPYLAPVPHRGRPNRPAHVSVVGAAIASTRGCSVAQIEEATWRNAASFYGLDAE